MGGEPGKFGTDKPLSAHQAGKLAKHGKTNYDPDEAKVESARLTERQDEVLALAALDDLENKDIAKRLGIAQSTVDTHFEDIFRNLGVKRRASAVTWYRRRRDQSLQKQVIVLKARNEALEKEKQSLMHENAALKALLAQHGVERCF